MKTIIAGSRNFTDIGTLNIEMPKIGWIPTLVISGNARGVDRLGEGWANMNNIPILRMPADWDTYGKAAGRVRNVEMANEAEALVAFWDGLSPGTRHMIDTAKHLGLKYKIVMV
jgi:hypothetical protein